MNENEKFIITSAAMELSEDTGDSRYITLTNRLCYYDEPNLNNVVLPSENAEEIAQTLIDMPVVAKYREDYLGNGDFGGHELSYDEEGDPVWGTEAIGMHKSVEIKDEIVTTVKGETKTLPCLYATSKIWTRNKNVVNTIKKLFENGGLFTSWEITTKSYLFENGVKTITDYEFTSNCLLSSSSVIAKPAYGNVSKTCDISTAKKAELLIAEALEKDIQDEKKGGEIMSEKTNQKDNNEEISELTQYDVHRKIVNSIYEKYLDVYYVEHIFPLQNYVLAKDSTTENELDYVKISYSIDSEGDVTVDEKTRVTLTISLSEVENVISVKDTEISEKIKALVKANEIIASLNEQIEKMQPFKEAYEKAETERIERELSEKRNTLREKLVKSNLFTSEEISPIEGSTEVSELIKKADEPAIIKLIGQRVMASLEKSTIETSEFKSDSITDTELSSVNGNGTLEDDVIDDGFSVSMLWNE